MVNFATPRMLFYIYQERPTIMPFTLSHAAAAIPFRRTRLIMSAVVMGCFVPDFPHFLFLARHIPFTHTIAGMFVLDLPVGLALLWLFHEFMKQPMLMFLPSGVRRRLTSSVNTFPFRPSERLALIVLSILTGTATHILWDAFTHRGSWICEHWTFFQGWVELPVTGKIQMYNLLEYASTFLGAAVVVVWILYWYRTTKPSAKLVVETVDPVYRRIFVAALPVLALLGGALWSWQKHGIHRQIRPIMHFTSGMLVSATTFFLLGLLAYGVKLRQYRTIPVASSVV
jgi:hypothetical protein